MLTHVGVDNRVAVVDRYRPEAADGFELIRIACCTDIGAKGLCDLDGDMANTAGTAMDKDLLPVRYTGPVDQSFPSRREDERQRSGFSHGEAFGQSSQQPGIDRRILRQRTLVPANATGHAIDVIPRDKIRNALSQRFDGAGQIDPENGGQGLAGMRRRPDADLGVQRVDAAGLDPDEHLARTGHRLGDLCNPERRISGLEKGSLHN